MDLSEVKAMDPPQRNRGCKTRAACVSSIIFCFLTDCTLGFYYSFGNITPYLTSYLRNLTHSADLDYTDTVWISQSQVATNCLLMPIMGLVSTRIGLKLYYTIGVIFTAGSYFGCYLTVQKSFPLTIVTYGIVGALPLAIFGPSTINVAARWMSHGKGFVTGLVLAGWGFGGFAWNQLTTWYINPDNLQPDVTVGSDKYYSQRAVLDRVPHCFIVIGCIMTGIQFLAVIFIFDPPPEYQMVESETVAQAPGIINESSSLLASAGVDVSPQTVTNESDPEWTGLSSSLSVDTKRPPQYHPKDVLRSRVFWTIWLLGFFTNQGLMFILTLFKAYGQTFIANDHFLSIVASISGLVNAASRPFWGMLSDKLGFRMVAIYAQCVLACFVATFVTCEVTGRVAYFVWVIVMYVCIGGYFTMLPPLVFDLFGSQYYNANQGLTDSNGILGAVTNAIIAPYIKVMFGWDGIFFASFSFTFIGILLTMSLELRYGNSIPPHMFKTLSIVR